MNRQQRRKLERERKKLQIGEKMNKIHQTIGPVRSTENMYKDTLQSKMKYKVKPKQKINLIHELSVNVIVTYEDEDSKQECFDFIVEIFNPKYKYTLIKRVNYLEYNGLYSPEKDVLSQIINLLKDLKKDTDKLVKISLCYEPPEHLKLYTNSIKDDFNNGYDFIYRTNSQYYFQPDQRDEFEEDIVKTFDISKKVTPYKELMRNWIHMEKI